MTVYITAVHMEPSDAGDHEHIAQVRWENRATGASRASSRETMVDWINDGGDARVSDSLGEVQVGVVANPPYLRTDADERFTDNLLSLPRY